MPNVSNLKVDLQTGTDSTYYATWDFKETITKTVTTDASIQKGDWVTIKSGATWFNGAHIPSWCFPDGTNDTIWYVYQNKMRGNRWRAVLTKNKSGNNNIESPIEPKWLDNGKTGGSTTTTETTNYLDHYEVKWYYATGDGVWFEGGSSNTESEQATYNLPSNAYKLKVSVKAVSKTHKVNDSDVAYWTSSWVSKEYLVAQNPPEKPPSPTVEIKKTKLKATVDNISDGRSDQIQFQVYNNTTAKTTNTIVANVVACRATMSCDVTIGNEYRVRCRAINIYNNDKVYGEWTDYTSSMSTIPSTPKSITSLKALSDTSVSISWEKSTAADNYEIQYTTNKSYFDSNPSGVKSVTVESIVTHAEITGMESGEEYFFRVKATNDKGSSGWTAIKSIIIGKAPTAPTTWSSTTTAITGEPLTLFWVHNSEDGSSQTYAQLEMYVDGVKSTQTIKNTTDEDEKDKTSSYSVDTSSYIEGTTIQWRVRTAGITKTYGDWSIQRSIDVYAQPVLELHMTDKDGSDIDTLSSFPFYLTGLAGPNTQTPIGYHVSVASNEVYESTDNVGNIKMVNAGEEVYSKYFDTNEKLVLEFSANNVDLQNGVSYTITCTVSMNSGLTATRTLQFTVNWVEVTYEPDAEIGFDEETYTAYVNPYCINEDGKPNDDVLLSVYRREFDGTFTEIATNVVPSSNTYILDPHPSLDYARYRIVAISKSTGAVNFYDPPGYPVKGNAVVIQWDDQWAPFDVMAEDELVDKPWNGSMLKIPYNIDVSDSNQQDVSLVNYIGRSYPVAYYGTQIGSTSTWSMEIPKDDKETLYNLRRLAIWMGDVYVREPSGSGYWANVKVSFNQKHRELTIPITLDVTRVEGGM